MLCLPLGASPSLAHNMLYGMHSTDKTCWPSQKPSFFLGTYESKHTHNMYYTPDNKKSCDIVHNIQQTNKKFKRACKIVVLLNNKLDGLQQRYNRARGDDRRSFRYNIRLRLCTVEGSRNMFYEYASQRADEMEELQDQLMTSEDEFYSSDGSANSDSDDSQH